MKIIKLTNTAVLLLLLALVGCGSDERTIEVTQPNENQTLEEYILSQDFSGAIYVAQANDIILSRGVGLANEQANIINTSDTIFRIGSITKQFTAAAILLLQERGQLTLDDPISEHLSDFPSGDSITIYHLLTHTSGLQNYTDLSSFNKVINDTLSPEQVMDLFKDFPLKFAPGSQFNYSNSGFIVLGVIIERLTGMTYQDFMVNEVFQPLSMSNSGYATNTSSDSQVAQGYSADGNSTVFIDMSLPYSAGSLISTVSDLAMWDRALYETNLLSDDSKAQMFTPNLEQYALGWRISSVADSEETVYVHSGNISGFSSIIMRFPQSEKVIIILANIDSYPTRDLAMNIYEFLKN